MRQNVKSNSSIIQVWWIFSCLFAVELIGCHLYNMKIITYYCQKKNCKNINYFECKKGKNYEKAKWTFSAQFWSIFIAHFCLFIIHESLNACYAKKKLGFCVPPCRTDFQPQRAIPSINFVLKNYKISIELLAFVFPQFRS